jgi:glycosyltransferase involved in cell wall biosynthesis
MGKNTGSICFFNSHYSWGGGEKWHHDTAMYLRQKQHNVIVCSAKNSELFHKMKDEMPTFGVELSNLSFLNPFKYFAIYRLLKKHRADTIILCLPIDVKVAGVAAKLAGLSNIIYGRGCAIAVKNSVSNRFLFKYILTHVIANSHATKATILQNNQHLIHPDKIAVLYNGIKLDLSQVKHKPARQNPIVIGTVGRLEPHKNNVLLLDAAKILKEKNYNFIIKIAGDGSQKDYLHTRIKELELTDCVELCGFQGNIHVFLNQIDIFALPSLGEGFGYVFCEAMLHKIPIVAFDVSSAAELIKNNFNGYLVRPYDLQEFASKIMLLIENEETCTQFGNSGCEYVKHNFGEEKNLALTEQFIINLHNKALTH